jgi:hypothetical protein
MPVDSRNEELTLENVDELVAQKLSQLQASQPPTMTSLSRTVRNLQIIYEEKRRVERVWERINDRASALDLTVSLDSSDADEPVAIQPAHLPGKAVQDGNSLVRENLNSLLRKPEPGKQSWRLHRWRNMGFGLVAALILITLFAPFFAWPMLASHFHGSQAGSFRLPAKPSSTATPQPQLVMRQYAGRYFKIQYPANWIIAGITASSTASYLQTVQFRPSTTSAIEINVSAMPDSNLSMYQLLHIDPHVKLGTLRSIHTVTYHKIPWAVGVVDLASSSPTQVNKLEIAYSKQTNPYRIEFGATPDTFEQYSTIFNAMLASFSPQIGPTITPPTKPSSTATPPTKPSSTATPLPTASVPAMKEYNNQHFKILYPANWVITSITTGGTSLQTVQFRPSATSTVFVKVDAMYMNNLSGDQLLNIDPDMNLGTRVSTSSVTYHGIPWSVGIVNIAGSLLVQPSKLEVAYSNQNAPYKIEFSAPPSTFASYSSIFDDMFVSFYSGG